MTKTVDFITFCYFRDAERVHAAGVLHDIVATHRFPFETVRVVHQRCAGMVLPEFDIPTVASFSEDHPQILTEFGVPESDPVADEWTHGPNASHYWKWHTINHLIGLKVSQADYIVFSDNDCDMKHNDDPGWVEVGIRVLERYDKVLVVSPSDGGHIADGGRLPGGVRLTQNNSQQLFLCNRERMLGVDYNIPWNWEVLAPWEPFQEYYYMMEGRIWRFMHHRGLYRAILPEKWRYWHYG